jgi:putative spermidine/putrescine transport system ATP-binding protein
MSNRIAVFNDGVVQQCARPDVLYERPSNAFVADFIGENNLIPGTVSAGDDRQVRVDLSGGGNILAQRGDCGEAGSQCIVSVRPEKLFFEATNQATDNDIRVTFVARFYVGDFIRYFFRLPSGPEIAVKVLNDQAAPDYPEGQEVHLTWLSNDCFAFKTM